EPVTRSTPAKSRQTTSPGGAADINSHRRAEARRPCSRPCSRLARDSATPTILATPPIFSWPAKKIPDQGGEGKSREQKSEQEWRGSAVVYPAADRNLKSRQGFGKGFIAHCRVEVAAGHGNAALAAAEPEMAVLIRQGLENLAEPS